MLTESQVLKRRNGIGGSDAAAVAGLSRFKTPYDIYKEKVDEPTSIRVANEAMLWGNIRESEIRERYEATARKKVEVCPDTFIHPKYDFIIGHFDGYIPEDRAILECKTVRTAEGWGKQGTAEIPDDYLCQVAHYVMIRDAKKADIAVLIGGCELRVYTYTRNENLENALLTKEINFWENYVIPRIPPPITTPAEARREYKVSSDEQAFADSNVLITLEELKHIKSSIKELTEKQKSLETNLMLHMRNAKELVDAYGNLLASWKNVSSSRFDVTAFKTSNPELYEEFTKENQTRRFLVK